MNPPLSPSSSSSSSSSSSPLLATMRRASWMSSKKVRRTLLSARPRTVALSAVGAAVFMVLLVLSIARAASVSSSSSSHNNNLAAIAASGPAEVELAEIAYTGLADQFPVPDPATRPTPDLVDTFAHFHHRQTCAVSALDIHRPFEPLCNSLDSLLPAMSGGGRLGFDAPYMPRGCDMRWYDTREICAIVGRFERIVFVGDAMMRHVVGALHVLLREDLGFGAVTAWNFRPDERDTCFCQGQFDPLNCGVQGIFSSEDVARFDPTSLKCDRADLSIQTHVITTHPPTEDELARLSDAFVYASNSRVRPVAVVYGQGHHNDLNVDATAGWLAAVKHAIAETLPNKVKRAELFVTPGGSGPEMYDVDVVRHGHKALSLFELGMANVCQQNHIDLLGTFNASVQTTLSDGKHSDIRANLLKAMMVLNWLDNVVPVEGVDEIDAGAGAGAEGEAKAEAAGAKARAQTDDKPAPAPNSKPNANSNSKPKPKPNPANTGRPVKEPKLPNHAAVAAVNAKDKRAKPAPAAPNKTQKSPGQHAEFVDKKSLSKVVPHENEHIADAPGPDQAPAAAGLPRRTRKNNQVAIEARN
ncbi:hypothetical protein V1509DRAFT_632429 [Lipomyces kononenkoae]